jgi:hypothetical protein
VRSDAERKLAEALAEIERPRGSRKVIDDGIRAGLRGPGDARSAEGNRLQHDHEFRRRVLDGYAALGARPVDATRTVDDIAAVILLEQVDAWCRASRLP